MILDPRSRSSIGCGRGLSDVAAHRIEPGLKSLRPSLSDLLYVHGEALRAQLLIERKDALQRLLRKSERIRYLQHVAEHGEVLYRKSVSRGRCREARRCTFKAGRSDVWKKVKTPAFKAIKAKRLEHIRK